MEIQTANLLDLLRADGSIVVNKKLMKKIGLVEAAIYSELVSLFKYWSDRGELTDEKWFFCTAENIEENTSLKRRQQDSGIKSLVKFGLIETKRMGVPAKRYFTITEKIVEFLLEDSDEKQECTKRTNKNVQNVQTDSINDLEAQSVQNVQTSVYEMDKQECAERTVNNTNNNIKSNKQIETYKDTLEDTDEQSDLQFGSDRDLRKMLSKNIPKRIGETLFAFSKDYDEMYKLYGAVLRAKKRAESFFTEKDVAWIQDDNEWDVYLADVLRNCFFQRKRALDGKKDSIKNFESYVFVSVDEAIFEKRKETQLEEAREEANSEDTCNESDLRDEFNRSIWFDAIAK